VGGRAVLALEEGAFALDAAICAISFWGTFRVAGIGGGVLSSALWPGLGIA